MAFNSLTFDGVNSLDYGIYITGESVYDVPERDVEAVEIAGRNGDYLLDKGRWKNIEVTYRCGCFGSDQTEFAEKIRTFRNLLASRRGYKRITDTYNTTEYRMGTFVNPVEVDSVSMKRAGEFDVVFNCKPQRWLTSGETATTVANNGTLTNPTAYDASPLLAVKGYGTITFNGHKINISNAVMGNVQILNGTPLTLDSYTSQEYGDATAVFKSDAIPVTAYANNGDSFTALIDIDLRLNVYQAQSVTNAVITTAPSNASALIAKSGTNLALKIKGEKLSGTVGTNATASDSCAASVTWVGSSTIITPLQVNISLAYNATTKVVTVTVTVVDAWFWAWGQTSTSESLSFNVDSTVSILGNPTYIDCDLGEAYMIKSNEYVSLNRHIDLGSDLPTLASGTNTFTKTNTITELKVTPRWWQL